MPLQDNSLGELVKRLPNLEHLGVANSRGITGACLSAIALHCSNLNSLKYARLDFVVLIFAI